HRRGRARSRPEGQQVPLLGRNGVLNGGVLLTDMREITPEVIQEIVDAFVRVANPRKIILFGSHARGDAKPDSDLDFLVVEDEPFEATRSRRREWRKLYDAAWDIDVPLDILLFSANEVDRWQASVSHVVRAALDEGLVLHERA
ncbi:MAG TPA: nucleotidyltransferase domain-containing protein, partial [Armatimonadota bacterium]|nr:nucleotidyltransferase domain-containing protein [Armatimonadota bacterium]